MIRLLILLTTGPSHYRWVRWKEHVEALLDPQSIANMGPNAFMPFGLANVMGQVSAS